MVPRRFQGGLYEGRGPKDRRRHFMIKLLSSSLSSSPSSSHPSSSPFYVSLPPHPPASSSSSSSSSFGSSSSLLVFPRIAAFPPSSDCMLLHFPDLSNLTGHNFWMGWRRYAKSQYLKAILAKLCDATSADAPKKIGLDFSRNLKPLFFQIIFNFQENQHGGLDRARNFSS